MGEIVIFLIVAAVLAGSTAWHLQQDKIIAIDWREVAERWGLRFEDAKIGRRRQIVGEAEGFAIALYGEVRGSGRSRTSYTVLRIGLPGPAPEGLALRREGLEQTVRKILGGQDIQLGDPSVDPELRIQGAEPEAVRECLHPRVLRDLINLNERTSRGTRFEGNALTVEVPETLQRHRLDSLLREGLGMARALNDMFVGPWEGLAADLGLQLRIEADGLFMEGRIDDQPVSVRLQSKGGAGAPVRIRASVGQPLPGGLELRPVVGDSRGIGLQDPVLDGVVAATADRPELARRFVRWAAEEVDLHGPLLAVLHAWPGSTVTGQAVHLISSSTAPSRVQRQVQDATELARLLRQLVQRFSE